MKSISSYSNFALNETISYQGVLYIIRGIKPLTRGLKYYTIERI